MNYVQAYISNISFPNSLDEVYDFAHCFDLEQLLGIGYDEDYEGRNNSWTAPKWCKKGDIVFFMHAKTADAKISKLKNSLLAYKESYSEDAFWTMMNALIRAKKLHDLYGGKIFAIGQISGMPIYEETDSRTIHWKSVLYAPIDNIFLLENPIDISEFNTDIMVSRQSSITPIFGKSFELIKNLVLQKNATVEKYLIDSIAEPMPLHGLTDKNWLEIVNRHRRGFFLEIQFRTFYVDRLLKFLGDTKNFYRECACKKGSRQITFIDNIIRINGIYLPVEVKLSISSEKNILSQLTTYCNLKQICLMPDKIITDNIYNNNVLVIDTDNIYIYYDNIKTLRNVLKLDDIKSNADIVKIRTIIINLLTNYENIS